MVVMETRVPTADGEAEKGELLSWLLFSSSASMSPSLQIENMEREM